MDRYSATRLALRIGILVICVCPAPGPAQVQVQVGELLVSPAPDGVTVTLAQADQAGQLSVQQPAQPAEALPEPLPVQVPGSLPRQEPQPSQAQSPALEARQEEQQPQRQAPQYVELQLSESRQQPPPPPAVTRIILAADSLPPARPVSRPLPPLPAPRSHQMERDVLTLKAARAAMQLDDQLRDRKIAALR